MIELTIDGKRVQARKGETLLTIARREGVEIPTLCHHEAVEPSGACRMCMVEITRPDWDGWSKLVTACNFPAEENLIVRTRTDKVMKTRKEILELLIARTPGSQLIAEMAREYGLDYPTLTVGELSEKCILCDICTRVCQNLVTGAISRINRGVEKEVNTPFAEVSDVCIGCLACAKSCPTDAIEFTQVGLKRTIWGRTFDLVPCTQCGAPTLPREQAEWLSERTGMKVEEYFVCVNCKAARTAQTYENIAW